MLGLNMIVRFEVDACSSADASTATATKTKTLDPKRPEKKTPAGSVDDLADALGGINLSTSAATPGPILNIIRGGTQVPQDTLLELATRSKYYVDQLDWNELYPQLALSQTPTLHLGVHERGTFTELREWCVDGAGASTDLAEQRQETAVQMERLARVLEDVQELAISRAPGPAGSFSLVCEDGELKVYGRKGAKSCLPPDVKARFAGAAGARV